MSQSALARAVRDRIAALAAFRDNQVTVEIHEWAPATAGDYHIIVTDGGIVAAPRQETSGCVIDKWHGIDVIIAIRSRNIPRDRTRNAWIALSNSFETYAELIEQQIDFSDVTRAAANAYILAETGSTQGFITPLVWVATGPIREAPPEIFAGFGDETAALVRTLQFRRARRIRSR